MFWEMLYMDTEKCKQHRFLVPKVEDECTDMVLSALSRARLYSDKLDAVIQPTLAIQVSSSQMYAKCAVKVMSALSPARL